MQQAQREWLATNKTAADGKLRRLGIPLSYTVGFTGEESGTDDKNHVSLRPEDRLSHNFHDKSPLHLMLHELSHVFLNTYVLKKQSIVNDPEVRRLFGDLTKPYKRKPGPKNNQPVYVSRYAQSHPEEDFAEIFAIYAKNDGDMNKIRHQLRVDGKSSHVYKQLEWMDKFIQSVAGRNRIR